ncbi:MAG: hypothetical protein AAGD05_14990, partial [Bacteroidota bacterium]
LWVATGTYYPTTCAPCSLTDRALSFVIPEGVALYGGFSGNENALNQRNWVDNVTILSGDINQDGGADGNSFSIVYTENVSSATLVDGFTIRGGRANDVGANSSASPARSGAAWYNQANIASHPRIRNCQFDDNQAHDFGGAIYNNARGGGMAHPNIQHCVFTANQAGQSGGAIFNDASLDHGASSPTIADCSFENNQAQFGAAIYNSGLEGISSPQILGCRFLHNEASSYGGACYNFGKGPGGQTQPFFANCVFSHNEAASAGAIYSLADGGLTQPEILNCTFYANHANTGGSVYCNESNNGQTEVTMTNCIFWGNTAIFNPIFHMSGDGTPIMNLSHSLVDAADCADIMFLDATDSLNCVGGLMFNEDPLFEDLVNQNFHLQANSPVKNMGSNSSVNQYQVYFDMDSLIRIHNEVVDFGAYEFDAPAYIVPSITQQPTGQEVCEGSPLTFELAHIGTGNITYQWQKEGIDIPGATQASYSVPMASLSDTGAYRCRITSFVMDSIWSEVAMAQVNALEMVAHSIEASTNNACAGIPIHFTATSLNAGATPIYEWQVNGEVVGENSPTYSSSVLSDGDEVLCVLTSSLDCVTNSVVTSSPIAVTITDALEVEVSISTPTPIACSGTPIDFIAEGMNVGSTPIYEWRLNGEVVGENSPTYSSS